jgi:Rrf2 family protein
MRPKFSCSMQLTRAADYGVRVMMHLATLQPGERALLPALAAATDSPQSFLSKVLQTLAGARMIASRRGKAGGFVLLESGRTATIKTVVEAIDGPISLNPCLAVGRSCSRVSWCPAHPVWAKAQRSMVDALEERSIAELAARHACSIPAEVRGPQPVVGFEEMEAIAVNSR